jgi:ribosomal protein L37AE/L43A
LDRRANLHDIFKEFFKAEAEGFHSRAMKKKTKKKNRQKCLVCRRLLTKRRVAAKHNPWICQSCMDGEDSE